MSRDSGHLTTLPTGAGRVALSLPGEGRLASSEPIASGYIERELLMIGEATLYTGAATSPAIPTPRRHQYVTRIIGRFPVDPTLFSGRVFVEPFNTTRGGVDHDRVWRQIMPLVVSQGDGWVGVTVRPSAADALKNFDPDRYADLSMPVNDVEWDILRHVGRQLKSDGPSLLGGPAQRLYLTGYSQSGVDTATFAMAFHGITVPPTGSPVYDGYLPSAHSGTLAAVSIGAARLLPPFEHVPMTAVPVPVVDLESQTDVEGVTVVLDDQTEFRSTGGAYVRRPDSDASTDLYRLYEVAGAAHIQRDPECTSSSSFPTDHFVRAAAQRLIRWAELGEVPPREPRIELSVLDEISEAEGDDFGNARGGVRSPYVDIPLSRYRVRSDPGSGGLYMLVGDEVPFSRDQAIDRYGDLHTYIRQFTASLDAAIEAGSLLRLDRDELLADQSRRARNIFGE